MTKPRYTIPQRQRRMCEPPQHIKVQSTFSPMENGLLSLLRDEALVNGQDEIVYEHKPGVYFTLSEGLKAIYAFMEIHLTRVSCNVSTISALSSFSDTLKLKQVIREKDIRQCLSQLRYAQSVMSTLSVDVVTDINNSLRLRNAMEKQEKA